MRQRACRSCWQTCSRAQFPLEILISDGGSNDASPKIAELAGGRVISVHPPGRGRQLAIAAGEARGDWLLFLHADSRLAPSWQDSVIRLLRSAEAQDSGWYFDLCIEPASWARRCWSSSCTCAAAGCSALTAIRVADSPRPV